MQYKVDNKGFQKAVVRRSEETHFGDVMVVGGGISEIQAALDHGAAGFRVYLVDSAPTIGGHMAQFDKTFPTNDCSMCIESPKFVECNRHPNIKLMTYAEVDSVQGEAENFTVTLYKKPKYIMESRCTGCTVCVEYCPAVYPDQFNQELSTNKAIHVVDQDKCIKCGTCLDVCPSRFGAIKRFPENPLHRMLQRGQGSCRLVRFDGMCPILPWAKHNTVT
jgi:heterodisulfide reductase subunit A-like polyferredoxin